LKMNYHILYFIDKFVTFSLPSVF